jgi:Uma2 family endonuclease
MPSPPLDSQVRHTFAPPDDRMTVRSEAAPRGTLPAMPPPAEGARLAQDPPLKSKRRKVPLPAVDERLVMPGTRFEVIDGKVEHVPPADEAHGSRHSKISALLEAHAAAGYDVAVDMLTRTSAKGDMAPDASVFPAARDPETGGRQLEEMAFEIVHTRRLGHAAKKARALSSRGVRRTFALDVDRRQVHVWSRPADRWQMLSNDAVIEDRTLAVPLPVRALVEAVKTDDALAAALLAKNNPVLESALLDSRAHGKIEGRIEGKIEGKIDALLALLSIRGIAVTAKDQRKIHATTDEAKVDRWFRRAATAASIEDVFRK